MKFGKETIPNTPRNIFHYCGGAEQISSHIARHFQFLNDAEIWVMGGFDIKEKEDYLVLSGNGKVQYDGPEILLLWLAQLGYTGEIDITGDCSKRLILEGGKLFSQEKLSKREITLQKILENNSLNI